MSDLPQERKIPRSEQQSSPLSTGQYIGEINSAFKCDRLVQALGKIDSRLEQEDAVLVAGGRNQNFRISLPWQEDKLLVLVKRFGSQSRIKDWTDTRFRSTKAQRSYSSAMHLAVHDVGTPTPVAYLQRQEGSRLQESYFISVYEQNLVEFREVLLQIIHHDARCSKLVPTLELVARLCRKMHDAGFQHLDLGNQNVLLRGDLESGFHSPGVIDLNRGRVHDELTLQQRGQDLVRLDLPSNLKLMFMDMYWGGPTPQALLNAHRRHLRLFQFRVFTRSLRHPFREARIAKASRSLPADHIMPAAKDLWIWDDYSDQPLAALDRRERSRQYPFGRGLRMFRDVVFAAPGVWHEYRRCRSVAFKQEVSLRSRIGIAVAPSAQTLEAELGLLAELGSIPVLVRVSHGDSSAQLERQYQLIKSLNERTCPVKLALLQDRKAVKDPASWQQFVLTVLDRVSSEVESIEFGHAINRVKWGLWSFPELRQFYGVLREIQHRYPDLHITGPATIDFEYPFMISALKLWPADVSRQKVSHHLYVDRRGAPENLQNGFSAVEKFALALAIAKRNGSETVEVSEVNWPIQGTGLHSPVTPPFNYPESSLDKIFDSGVDESLAADYIVRYLVLAICSGLVDRVYWWRLVARGYGLVDCDEEVSNTIRCRPAFNALRHFLQTLGSARFIEAKIPGLQQHNKGSYQFHFLGEDGEEIVLSWAHGDAIEFPQDIRHGSLQDLFGNVLHQPPVELGSSPVYFRQVQHSD